MPTLPGRSPLLLELDLTQPLVDPPPEDPLARLRAHGRRQLRPTLRALYEAGDDPRVHGLVAKVGGVLPWAEMQELRLAVAAFAASGKPTLAWAETFGDVADTAGYVLATAFGRIWLQPGGSLGLLGTFATTTFLGGTLERLGVQPQFEARHEYKNAVDVITRTGFTEAHRAAVERVTASQLEEAVERVAEGRGLPAEQVRALVDRGPHLAAEARDAGLVDRLGYRDQVLAAARAEVAERAGTDAEAELVYADRWSPRPRLRLPRPGRGRVALVRAHGDIVSGRSRRTPTGRRMGSDTVAGELRAALADEQVEAVVLHVDSPGGSAVASEVVWREVVRLREAGRPVVVAMGALAASGGYYISCAADAIVALPGTLTGSIGVFGGKLVVEGLLAKASLRTGLVEQGERALMYSGRRPYTDDERARLAASVDAIYTDFVGKVAAGRGRPYAEVEPLARGRVWTGRDALAHGLVDRIGGLREAVALARERAGLPDDAPVGPAVRISPLDRLNPPGSSDDPRAAVATTSLPGAADLAALARSLGLLPGTELRMPPLRVG